MQAHTCRLFKFIPVKNILRKMTGIKRMWRFNVKVQQKNTPALFQLPYLCAVRRFSYIKTKIPCFTSICFNTSNKAGLLWILLLHSYTSSCSEVRVTSSIQLRTCFGLCLLTLTLVSLLHSTGKASGECWLFCSFFVQCYSTLWRLSHKVYSGLSPESIVSNNSRECFCCTVKNLTAVSTAWAR